MSGKLNPPLVVLSLDFEMRWGVHDIYGLDFDLYRENIENVRLTVPILLKLFKERSLKATWATVGALCLSGWQEYYQRAPQNPDYLNKNLRIKEEYASLDPDGLLHFAPDLVDQVVATEGQELGNHSFSHIYFREPGVTKYNFLNEMKVVEQIWDERYGLKPVSLVFPRNQSAFLNCLKETSIKIWRGTEPTWYHGRNTQENNSKIPKLLRLIDSVNCLKQNASSIKGNMSRAGLFVRFNLPEGLWKLHIKRIYSEIRHLLPGDVFHLWWHPHNLGGNMKVRIPRLIQVLDLIAEGCSSKRVLSKSMKELL